MARVVAYDELRLRIDGPSGGPFRVLASFSGGQAAAGEATGEFSLPERELERFLSYADAPRRAVGSSGSPTDPARRFGEALFDALFTDEIRTLYGVARVQVRANGANRGLRVTLCLSGAPGLMDVPWEYLYHDHSFLAASESTPVVRYLDLSYEPAALSVALPINLLGVVSTRPELDQLAVDRERENLETALAGPLAAGALTLQWLEQPTLTSLLEALESQEIHVLHFIGHGAYDPETQRGVIMLRDDAGATTNVDGGRLGQVVHDHASLRLVVLNACSGARSGDRDPFAGIAAALVGQRIPAVVAMQTDITDVAAVMFSTRFYRELAAGLPVDAAVTQGRLAIFADQDDGIEWGSPVVFMRVADGRIFDLPSAGAVPKTSLASVTPMEPQRRERSWRRRPREIIAGAVGIGAIAAGAVIWLGTDRASGSDASSTAASLCDLVVKQTKASAGQNRTFAAQMRNAPNWQAARAVLEAEVTLLTANLNSADPLVGALVQSSGSTTVLRELNRRKPPSRTAAQSSTDTPTGSSSPAIQPR